MNARRFYSDQPIQEHSLHTLTDTEHQHLAKVLRAQPGDSIILFDGSGPEFPAEITAVKRQETELRIGQKIEVNRELPFEITLGVALPKGDRQQWVVEKLVELGVTRLIPLKTQFGVAQPNEKAMQRISRWVIAASKQCGRNRLMEVGDAVTLEAFTETQPSPVWIAHPGENAVDLRDGLRASVKRESYSLAIGPEGGFSDDEIELATKNGHKIMTLGGRILRIETAAVASASAVIYACQP